MFSRLLIALLPILGSTFVNALTGEQIADALYQHPNECKDPSDGGIWAPLQGENPACGSKTCSFPQQWCSATSDPTKNQNTPNLNCVDLPADCQKAVSGGDTTTTEAQTTAQTTAAAAQTTAVTTQQATTSATQPSTPAMTKASAASGAPAGPTTAAPGGTTASGCKDNHDYCCFWAARQQCNANPGWMRTNCQQSCGTCGCQASGFQSCKVTVNTAGCKWLNGGAGGGNKVRVVLGGGPGLAALGFPNPGSQGASANAVGGQSNIMRVPIASSGIGGMPGMNPISPTGGNAGAISNSGGAAGGVNSGRPSSIVTIPVGRKRRHFMPRWMNV